MDDESALADGQLVAGMDDFLLNARAVDLDAVGAVEVAQVPVAVAEVQLGVRPGNVRKAHANVAGLAPPDGHHGAQQRNGIAAPDWDQLAVHLFTHASLSSDEGNDRGRWATIIQTGADRLHQQRIINSSFLLSRVCLRN